MVLEGDGGCAGGAGGRSRWVEDAGGALLGPDAYIAHVDGLDGPTMVYPSG